MISRIRITNYRGIRQLDVQVPPGGAIARGANGRGKTSLLRAIRAALAAQDVGPDAITLGEDRAEILVDLDALRVRRTITPTAQSVSVIDERGMRAQRPAAMLAEMLGTAPLDPLDLVLERDRRKRRATILGALPVTVTREQLEAWCPDLPAEISTEGHGLDVVARVHRHYYERRAAANRLAAEARGAAERAEAALQPLPSGEGAPSIADATAERRAALAAHAGLTRALEVAAEAHARTVDARQQIAGFEARAAELRAQADAERIEDGRIDRARHNVAHYSSAVDAAEEALSMARGSLERAERELASLERAAAAEADHRATAAGMGLRADQIRAALAAAQPVAPTREELDAAEARMQAAEVAEARALERARYVEAREAWEAAVARRRAADVEAEDLDRVVRALANDAPATLLRESGAIPGLSVSDDDVVLDGKRLDALCGREQIVFAVEIARRLNERAKLLVVDGLERLDPEQYETFVREATRDGWQLIGSRVDRGELVIEAIGEAGEES